MTDEAARDLIERLIDRQNETRCKAIRSKLTKVLNFNGGKVRKTVFIIACCWYANAE